MTLKNSINVVIIVKELMGKLYTISWTIELACSRYLEKPIFV